MRIPLDYYRILGLPIQATPEQLEQAHRDRVQQLPRREFSEAAIDARKSLIDEAYAVLSDPAQRQDYDASFLAKSYLLEDKPPEDDDDRFTNGKNLDLGLDPYTPSIEIQESQFIGALLILQELGEYELVLRLGRPYLSGGNLSVRTGEFGDPEIVAADIVLTIALACLELGREQWQQGQYENAAESLEIGQDLLLREGLFANLRGEMQADVFKLRPYRILELLALPLSQLDVRRQGLSLLEDMLQDRGGIDGSGDDQSGLNVDDFLRFIQQLRSYLTVSEQQTLFETEARRPSAVATYLAVYALLARGFAQRQPALIRRAKSMLIRLGTRQDVHLEQAVCALLLGQTEEASRALELSKEFESLTFIREHSQGSPDLLPGLCLYSERWLQNDVFPHFRDLARKQASLKEYFADEDVQSYLEALPNDPESSPQGVPASPAPSYSSSMRRQGSLLSDRVPVSQFSGESLASQAPTITMDPPAPLPVDPPASGTAGRGPHKNGTAASNGRPPKPEPPRPISRPADRAPTPPEVAYPAPTGAPARRPARGLRLDRVLLLAAVGLLGLAVLGFVISRLFGGSDRPQPATVSSSSVQSLQLMQPVITEFAKTIAPSTPTGPLSETTAPAIIQAWLTAKSAALGEQHDVAQLDTILVDPALSQQRERAETTKSSNSYWQYQHSGLQIDSVETNQDTPDQALIEATVTEKGDLYANGKLDKTSSYESTVKVRYDLVQQNGQWRIRDWQVLD